MIKVAMLSFWHVHANDYAKQAEAHEDTVITAIWDEIPERGRQEAEKRGVRYYESLDELLENDDIEAVIVDTPTNLHHDVMVKAANAGKHIFTEKVIAPTLQEVNSIVAAVKKAGVKLTVSLPRLNDGYTLAVQRIIAEGHLGELTLVRVRLSHNGATAGWLPAHFYGLEECAGGALIDLGCHPMYLTRLFLGLPESVSAHFGYVTGKEAEDNAVAVLKYANGALGIVEAGFVNDHSPFSIELHGTKGTLLYGTPDDRILLRSSLSDISEWKIEPLESQRLSAFDQWVDHIKNDTEATENIQLAVELTKLMEASNRSANSNRTISLSDLAE